MIVKNYLFKVLCKFLVKIESTWRREINQPPEVLVKISQYLQEAPVLESLFKKVPGLKACNLIKKRPQHRCSPVNIVKIFKTTYFEEHLRMAVF